MVLCEKCHMEEAVTECPDCGLKLCEECDDFHLSDCAYEDVNEEDDLKCRC